MSKFIVPVYARATHDHKFFYQLYIEKEVEAETEEEAKRIALAPIPPSAMVKTHPHLMYLVDVKPWPPDDFTTDGVEGGWS